ncbi:alkaline phosphatase D family protein, partial [Aquabacterium sp.]|uniref:alkaline phosphatase D family protein n=1 Tax=Aquabacterium sp. TaxID=1872578 RepID=UPI0025C32CFC
FTLGVASGEPLPESVVIWTRLAPQPMQADGGMPAQTVPVHWTVALDARFDRVVATGRALATPERGHSVHAEVSGLQPGRTHYYRFEAGGQTSPVGRTRTAPAPDARNQRMRLALASCQHYEAGYFAAHREIAAADVDLVAFVGDYLYETDLFAYHRVRRHPHRFPSDEADFTLADYRVHHASYKLDADLRACHAAHPWLLVWDDHEVVNDYAGDSDPDLPDVQAFLKLRTAAYQAYFEHLPISPRRAPTGAHMPMHAHYEWGQLAEFWTVDTRQFRDAPVCSGFNSLARGKLLRGCEAAKAPERSMLGFEQEAWLAEGLAGSTRAWKFIVQSTQVSPGAIRSPLGPLLYADGWDAFPAARSRLMQAIAQPRVPDVVCLGGDVHRHVAANLRLDPSDPASPIVASEIVGSSISSRGLSELLNNWLKGGNPDMLHARSDERGYVLLDVTPQRVQVDFRATPHPVRPDSRFHTQARYVIDRGVPGPRKA